MLVAIACFDRTCCTVCGRVNEKDKKLTRISTRARECLTSAVLNKKKNMGTAAV